MQRAYTVLILSLLTLQLNAQQGAKRYLLLEHFTNTPCPICASANPGFYNTIAGFAEDVHHIAYHPPIPYSSCVFYQANPQENSARATYYNVLGTPRVYFNGSSGMPAGQVSASILEEKVGQLSPLALQVQETGLFNRQVQVNIFSPGTPPSGNLRLFVAVVEKEVQYNAPNGETLHRDVFRKMLSGIDGDPFNPADAGGSVTASYNFSVQSGWNVDQIYVLAFIQDISTKEVFNSGTRFDPVMSSTAEPAAERMQLYPNPAETEITLEFGRPATGILSLRNGLGKVLLRQKTAGQHSVRLDVRELPAGAYWVFFENEGERLVQSFVKP